MSKSPDHKSSAAGSPHGRGRQQVRLPPEVPAVVGRTPVDVHKPPSMTRVAGSPPDFRRRSSVAHTIRTVTQDMPQDTFKIARVVTFVVSGWLLVIYCMWWQYKILEPYLRALLWAVIVSFLLRKFWPEAAALMDAGEEVVKGNAREGRSHCVREMWTFMSSPFKRFAKGDRCSDIFIGLLGRAWILRLIWFGCVNWLPVVIVVACAGVFLLVWTLGLFLLRRVRGALGLPVGSSLLGRAFTAHGVLSVALSITMLGLFIFSILQAYYEVALIYRNVTSVIPSGRWSGEVERVRGMLLQQLQTNNSTDLDICEVMQGHLELDESFTTVCGAAKVWLTSYLVTAGEGGEGSESNSTSEARCRCAMAGAAGFEVAVEPEEEGSFFKVPGPGEELVTCPADMNVSGINITAECDSVAASDAPAELTDSPFEMVTRLLDDSVQTVLFHNAPLTFRCYDGIRTYLQSFFLSSKRTRIRKAALSSDFEPMVDPTLSDLWAAAAEAGGELQGFAASLGSLSNVAASAQEVGKFTMSTSWNVVWQTLYGLVSAVLFAFDAFFQMTVFLSATLYLYTAEMDLLEHFKSIVESVDEVQGERLYEGLDASMIAVLGAPLKLAFFHAAFTCLLLLCFQSPFVCLPTVMVAVISVVFPSLACLGAFMFGAILLCAGSYAAGSAVTAFSFFVWWYVPTAIYEDIEGQHSFLTGLVVVMGASCMGPIGVIIGPLLLVVPYHFMSSVFTPDDNTKSSSQTASFVVTNMPNLARQDTRTERDGRSSPW